MSKRARRLPWRAPLIVLTLLTASPLAHAASSPYGTTFLWLAVMLIVAKLASGVERLGVPAVLGELLAGVALGNLVWAGIAWAEPIKSDQFVEFCAQLGVVILLFQVGLETNLDDLRRVGLKALGVALIGVAVPFVLGATVVGPWLLPGLGGNAYLFIGAALTATSVGITGRVFRDMGVLQSDEARIVLGAAVIDDVLGIVILAVISSIVTQGSVSATQVAWLLGESVLFLGGALIVGRIVARPLASVFARVSGGVAMKLTVVISTALLLAWLANAIGLAPIIGAFAAGALLEPAFLQDFEKPELVAELEPFAAQLAPPARQPFAALLKRVHDHHPQQLIEPLGHLFVPVFFVYTGTQVDLSTLGDPKTVVVALVLTVVALAGKIVAGLAAGAGVNRWLIGWGMAPRGEVGLIFAAVGRELGVVTPPMFSVIVVMVVLTTLVTPPVLSMLIRRQRQGDSP